MKVYPTNQLLNVVLCGNAGSGKTTLAESMLHHGGVIQRRGDVSSKNTVSDYNPIEHENGNSVFSSLLYTEFNNKKVNILDAPGADDFVGGVVSSLNVADLAVIIINSQNGIEVGTEIHGRYTEAANKPQVFVFNHLDHDKANFEKTLESTKERFGNNVILVQFPVEVGPGFNAVIDVIKMKMYKYGPDGGKPEIVDIPAEHKERADELHNELVEKAAENDEGLMELFFENDSLTEDEMRQGIKAGLLERGIFPVFCVSAKKNMGVGRLTEFLTNVGPTTDEMPIPVNSEGQEIKPDANGPASIFIFKTAVEPHIGDVSYFKVMSGKISEGMDLVNAKNGNKERLSQLFVSAGKTRTKVSEFVAGDIGVTVKLKSVRVNDTLNAAGQDWTFPAINFPDPKFRTAIKPVNENDDEKLGEALNRMHNEDPTILIEYSKELKQIIISGQGEYHINILKWHLDNIFKIETELISPRIPYRETITKIAQADYRHKKQSGGSGQFGEVHMLIEPYIEGSADKTMVKLNGKEYKLSIRNKEEHPLAWGGKLVFYNCIVGGSIDARFLPAILKGIMERMEQGPLTGSYARDICVYVYDGKMHQVDSNEISFKLAGRNAFSKAFKEAGPKILEPVYDVEVWVPSDAMGDVMSDLQGRRGMVLGMSSEKGFEKIKAKVPLAEMNKYSTTLSSISGGRAMYNMKFAEYAAVPGDVQEVLLKAHEAEQEDEE